jgi:exopolysaccharide production protein ExoZ
MVAKVNPYTVLPIQYLRGIAAVMVVWHHTRVQIPAFYVLLPGSFGASGVDIFFVISGFIMQITTARTRVTPVEFMVRRIIRIVPMYWALTIGMVLIWCVVPNLFKTLEIEPSALIRSLLFIPNFSSAFPGNIFPLLIPGWTLNYEMFFYVLFSAGLFFNPRFGLIVLTITIVLLVVTGIAFGPFEHAASIFYTSPVLLEFLAGVLMGEIWRRFHTKYNRNWGIFLFITGWILLIGNGELGLSKYLTILGASLIVAGSLAPVFLKISSGKLKMLGDATYSIYLTHIFTLGLTRFIWLHTIGSKNTSIDAATYATTSMLLCVGVGVYVYLHIEKPTTRYLNAKYWNTVHIGTAHP